MPWTNGSVGTRTLLDDLDTQLERAALDLLRGRGPGATVSVAELALAVGGEDWLALLRRARLTAMRLAAREIVELIAGSGLQALDETHAGALKIRLKSPLEFLLPSAGTA